MFSKLFSRKKSRAEKSKKTNSEPVIGTDVQDYKPIIYYSTDKAKYITANVPIKMTLQTKYVHKNPINTNNTLTGEEADELNKIYDLYIEDDENTDIHETQNETQNETQKKIHQDEDFLLDSDIQDMVYGGSYSNSKNLDYIMTHFTHDVESGIYYKTRPNSYYSDIIGN
jgi:hypothetical protein